MLLGNLSDAMLAHQTARRGLYGHLFRETSVSAMNKLAMRIAGAANGSNVVEMATRLQHAS